MDTPPELFDAHVHPDGLSDADLESMRFFGVRAALVAAHHTTTQPTAAKLLAHFEDIVDRQLPRLERHGIRGYAALGLHPQSLPRRGAGEVLARLPEFFRGGKVVALGAIGLHVGDEAEEEVFLEQLQLARRLKLPVMVHTPRENKDQITRRTLNTLRKSLLAPGRALVDHASGRTLRLILECGHYAGLTLHPEQLSAEKAVAVVRRSGSERLVLDTDAGVGAGDILAMARAVSLLRKAKLSIPVVSRVAFDNAAAFFRVNP
jgi:uncharacterized protein